MGANAVKPLCPVSELDGAALSQKVSPEDWTCDKCNASQEAGTHMITFKPGTDSAVVRSCKKCLAEKYPPTEANRKCALCPHQTLYIKFAECELQCKWCRGDLEPNKPGDDNRTVPCWWPRCSYWIQWPLRRPYPFERSTTT